MAFVPSHSWLLNCCFVVGTGTDTSLSAILNFTSAVWVCWRTVDLVDSISTSARFSLCVRVIVDTKCATDMYMSTSSPLRSLCTNLSLNTALPTNWRVPSPSRHASKYVKLALQLKYVPSISSLGLVNTGGAGAAADGGATTASSCLCLIRLCRVACDVVLRWVRRWVHCVQIHQEDWQVSHLSLTDQE